MITSIRVLCLYRYQSKFLCQQNYIGSSYFGCRVNALNLVSGTYLSRPEGIHLLRQGAKTSRDTTKWGIPFIIESGRYFLKKYGYKKKIFRLF